MGNYRNFKLVYYFIAQGTARAEKRKLEKDIRFFEKYLRPDKVYLEPFRSGIFADGEQVRLCRELFEKHGVEVAGGLTTSIPTPEGEEPKQRMFEDACNQRRKEHQPRQQPEQLQILTKRPEEAQNSEAK